jgi:hypothetical protein
VPSHVRPASVPDSDWPLPDWPLSDSSVFSSVPVFMTQRRGRGGPSGTRIDEGAGSESAESPAEETDWPPICGRDSDPVQVQVGPGRGVRGRGIRGSADSDSLPSPSRATTGATVPPHAVGCGQAGHRQEESLRPLRSVGAQLRWASGSRSRADSRQGQMAAALAGQLAAALPPIEEGTGSPPASGCGSL